MNSTETNMETRVGERVCLYNKKQKRPWFYVIRNKTALTFLTRLVFVVLMLFSAGVITTSIWLMMECRQSFTSVRPMLPRNIQFCTNMGMPALFACCIVLFAIFGLGCTGRRLTGYALIIISSVEILQSVTALTFYKCNTLSRQEITRSVNSSLFPCYSPQLSDRLFADAQLSSNTAAVSHASAFGEKPPPANSKRQLSVKKLVQLTPGGYITSTGSLILEQDRKIIQSLEYKSPNKAQHNRSNDMTHRDIKVPTDTVDKGEINGSLTHNIHERSLKFLTQNNEQAAQTKVVCSAQSQYFRNLSQKLKKSELNSCIQVCKTYQAVCPLARATKTDILQFVEASARSKGGLPMDKAPNSRLHRQDNAVRRFEGQVEDCGYRIFKHVSDLCFYDNKIILPISLCAPFLCIVMSGCFIYLAYCDRRLKEETQPDICIQVPESDASKSSARSLLDCCLSLTDGIKSVLCRCRGKLIPIWKSLAGCRHCTSMSGHGDSECSNSTHELLHLQALASGNALSPSVSQYTLNASVTDDCAPILSGWS